MLTHQYKLFTPTTKCFKTVGFWWFSNQARFEPGVGATGHLDGAAFDGSVVVGTPIHTSSLAPLLLPHRVEQGFKVWVGTNVGG
jgi:hypothetical protein